MQCVTIFTGAHCKLHLPQNIFENKKSLFMSSSVCIILHSEAQTSHRGENKTLFVGIYQKLHMKRTDTAQVGEAGEDE